MSRAGPEVLFGLNKDLRGSRSLLFISFKKGHTSDIRPATLSSWLKQTILLCYKQADQQALDLVQVKAHDIRAFAASKAFYGGVSVDQIMQACHWKAHNTFTNFYLKDLTWSDTDNNMYLGPVVAAQQVLDPSPQTSCPRKEKRGGAHPLQPSLQESLPGSRYSFTFKMLRVRSFLFFSYQVTSIKDLLSLISYSGCKKFMRCPTMGWSVTSEGPSGTLRPRSERCCTSVLQSNI